MLLITGAGEIVSANPAAGRELTAKRTDLPRRSLTDFVLNPPEDLARFLKHCCRTRTAVPGSLLWNSADEDGATHITYRVEGALLRPRDGEKPALIQLRLRPREAANRRFQILNQRIEDLSREIHARRRAEESLLELTEQLADADKRKNVFLATLAHELRNPLGPIRTGLEILKMKPDDVATVEKIQSIMEGQVKQLTVLVNDLLDISRFTRGMIEIRPEKIALNEVIQSALGMSLPVIEENSHTLVQDLSEPSPEVTVDPHRLSQIVSNLLTNAAKYTSPGGNIELTARTEGDEILIRVSDNGMGIAQENQQAIFTIFHQLPPSSDRTNAGLGVGLTLVKRLVELHSGTIIVVSEGENRGSTFEVRLPVKMSN